MVDIIQFFKDNGNIPMTLNEIHKYFDISKESISYQLRRLSRHGIIIRDVKPELIRYGNKEKAKVNIQTYCLSRYGLENW